MVTNRVVTNSAGFVSDFYDVRGCPRITVALTTTVANSDAGTRFNVQSSLDGMTNAGALAFAQINANPSAAPMWTATGYVIGIAPAFDGPPPHHSAVTLTPHAPQVRFVMEPLVPTAAGGATVTFSLLWYCAP